MATANKSRHFFKLFAGLSMVFAVWDGMTQIESGDTTPKTEESGKEQATFNEDSLKGINYYFSGMGLWTYRTFQDKSVYGIYDERYDERASFRGGMNLGVFFPLSEKFDLDIGATYFATGEKFASNDSLTDSSLSYLRRYLHFGVPLKLRFTTGEKFQFFGFAGLTAMNILQIRYDEKYTDTSGKLYDPEELKIKEGFTGFHLMASAGVGVQYNFRYVGYFLSTEYRQHFMNTYDRNQVPVIHRQFGFGFSWGAYLRF